MGHISRPCAPQMKKFGLFLGVTELSQEKYKLVLGVGLHKR